MRVDADAAALFAVFARGPAALVLANAIRSMPRRVACTLLPGRVGDETLAGAPGPITLDHPRCARFCVFGVASCTPAGTL